MKYQTQETLLRDDYVYVYGANERQKDFKKIKGTEKAGTGVSGRDAIYADVSKLSAKELKYLAMFDRAAKMWFKEMQLDGKSKDTIDNIMQRVNQYRAYMVNKEMCAPVSSETIYRYKLFLTEKGLKPSTVRQYLTELRMFINWGCEEGHKFFNDRFPDHVINKVKKQNYDKLLTLEEIQALVSVPERGRYSAWKSKTYIRRRLVCLLMLMLGLRASEVCNIRYCDVDMEKHTLFVNQAKGDKKRLLELPTPVEDVLKEYLERGEHPDFSDPNNNETNLIGIMDSNGWRQFDRVAIYRAATTYSRQAIGREINPHAYRHASAAYMYSKGATLEDVRQFLGHEDTQTTRIYISKLFANISARGVSKLWDNIEYENSKAMQENDEFKGIVSVRRNVIEKQFSFVAVDENGDEYDISVDAESQTAARTKAEQYCHKNGLKLKR